MKKKKKENIFTWENFWTGLFTPVLFLIAIPLGIICEIGRWMNEED